MVKLSSKAKNNFFRKQKTHIFSRLVDFLAKLEMNKRKEQLSSTFLVLDHRGVMNNLWLQIYTFTLLECFVNLADSCNIIL